MTLLWSNSWPCLELDTISPTTLIITGALLTISAQIIVKGFWRFTAKNFNQFGNTSKTDDAIYGLDHGKLNINLPPQSMWMNMGFWRDVDKNDFPGACRALLYTLLDQASLLASQELNKPRQFRNDIKNISILDVGFGCGDQTLCLADLASSANTELTYLGITLSQSQHTFAQQRLSCLSSSPSYHRTNNNITLYHGDAALPETWSQPCHEIASSFPSSKTITTTPKVLLALDTLYHFSPSRLPLLLHASKSLHLDLLAFDILLSDTATPLQTFQLRILGLLSGCPWKAFLTESEYRSMLSAAGYGAGEGDGEWEVVMTDITEHVFRPLSGFMGRHKVRLESIGLKMGKLGVAGWLFGWWARSGVVRGVVVTAKMKRERDIV